MQIANPWQHVLCWVEPMYQKVAVNTFLSTLAWTNTHIFCVMHIYEVFIGNCNSCLWWKYCSTSRTYFMMWRSRGSEWPAGGSSHFCVGWSSTELPSDPAQPSVVVAHYSLCCLPFASERWTATPWLWLCSTMRRQPRRRRICCRATVRWHLLHAFKATPLAFF